MAIALTSVEYGSLGNLRCVTGVAAFDTSYPTGGEALTPATLGMSVLRFIVFEPRLGFVLTYDHTNSKVIVYTQGYSHGTGGGVTTDDYPLIAGPGVTAGPISVQLTTGAGVAVANLGPMVETLSTDDLSTLVGVRFFAIGF